MNHQPRDTPNRLTGSEKDKLRKKFGHNRLSGSEMDSGRKSKSKALKGKTEHFINGDGKRTKMSDSMKKAIADTNHSYALSVKRREDRM